MKRIITIILSACLCLIMCGCLSSSSTSSAGTWDEGYDTGYDAGYEKGYKAGKDDASYDMYDKLSEAAEQVMKALATLEDLPSKAYKIDGMDDVYDAVAKADNILSKYR